MGRLFLLLGLLAACDADAPVERQSRIAALRFMPACVDTGFDSGLMSLAEQGLDGEGVRVGLWDEAAPRARHEQLLGRVRVRDAAGVNDHATQAAATLVGIGAADEPAGALSSGELWAHDYLFHLAELQAAAPYLDLSIHPYMPAMGWQTDPGCPEHPIWFGDAGDSSDAAFGKYGTAAAVLDRTLYWLDLVSVWSAGNQRLDVGAAPGETHYHSPSCQLLYTDAHGWEINFQYDTLGGPATAKNAISVGAVLGAEGDAMSAAQLVPHDFSSFGPTDDGRIKPDLVASGQPARTASGSSDLDYESSFDGTSRAASLVAGAVGLLTQQYRLHNGDLDPRAAEIKALLIHTAREVGSAAGPDYQMGWGVLDAAAAAGLLERDGDRSAEFRELRVDVSDGLDSTLRTVEVASGTAIRVTLVWIDPPGAPNNAGPDDRSPALVNDLDLTLLAPDGQTLFHPWRLDPNRPSAAAVRDGPNRVDPVEVVAVDGPDNLWDGSWAVVVAVNGALSNAGNQAYALASSAPLDRPRRPVLGSQRRLELTTDPAADPAAVAVPIENLGGGQLDWRVAWSSDWLTVTPTSGTAPEMPRVQANASALLTPGSRLGSLRIESNADPTGARTVGVVLSLSCAGECGGRECGPDPLCGTFCGGCGREEYCSADGRCTDWASSCPHGELGQALGQTLVTGRYENLGRTSGSCGGELSWDAAFGWSAPEAGLYRFSTEGSATDSVLYLRDDCTGTELACNDAEGRNGSAVAVSLDAGQRVVAIVDGAGATSTQTFTLNVDRAACPDADLGRQLGYALARASTQSSVDRLAGSCGGNGDPEAAFGFTAPLDGDYSFVASTRFDSVLYLLGDSCSGAELACSDTLGRHELTLTLAAGERVVAVVDGRGGFAGQFQLDVLSTTLGCDDGCIIDCQPDCSGRSCGDDGCGERCGRCLPGERCQDGQCLPDPCAEVRCQSCERCQDGACQALPDGASCEDGDPCSVFDSCQSGSCSGVAPDCDDGVQCTEDSCDPSSGACTHELVEDCVQLDCSDADATDTTETDSGADPDAGKSARATNGSSGGCGCSFARGSGSGPQVAAAALLALLCLRRRRCC